LGDVRSDCGHGRGWRNIIDPRLAQDGQGRSENIQMKAALYARVSTDDKGQDPERQMAELRRYAEAMGWSWVEYVDQESGGTTGRLAYQLLMEAVDKRRVDVVVVWSLDRLGRSLMQLILDLEKFNAKGVLFHSHTEGIDTTTPVGRLSFHILGALAEYIRVNISDNVKSGMARARDRGQHIGRPALVNDDVIRNVLELRSHRVSIRKIAEEVGVSKSTVQNIVKQSEEGGPPTTIGS